MNADLCAFLALGGWMLLADAEEERAVLRLRPLLVELRVPFSYETAAEYYARKRTPLYEPRFTLWRPLKRHELKLAYCF